MFTAVLLGLFFICIVALAASLAVLSSAKKRKLRNKATFASVISACLAGGIGLVLAVTHAVRSMHQTGYAYTTLFGWLFRWFTGQ